ncbi:MAG TPA: TonB-dependent receptor [Caulobacteraceae bacterium]
MRHLASTASFLVLSAVLSAGCAQAETQPASSGEPQSSLQEVVVTAQKRAENVQQVPIAVTAFTATSLQERAVGSVAQLSGLVPNVNLDAGTPFSGSPSVLSAYIRGIGSDDFAFNIDPGVGIYVDGVYLARTVGANQDLLDVDRIEVLKGPQGTLFGRNTIGGAISIVTRDPGNVFRFTGDVTTGSYNLLQVRGSADLPLTENLAASVTFGVKSRAGYLKRIAYPDPLAGNSTAYTAFPSSGFDTAEREGGDNNWNLRGKLKWRSDRITITLAGDYTHEDSTGLANKLLATAPSVPGNFAGASNLPGTAFDPTGTTGFLFAGLYNFCIGATSAQIAARNAQALCGVRGTQYDTSLHAPALASVNVDGNPNNDLLPYDNRFVTGNIDTSYATGNSFSKLTNWGLSSTIAVDITPTVSVKSITAYRDLDWRSGMDADGSPLNIAQLSFAMKQWQFSQEVQILGSAFDKRLNFVLGGYYFKEKGSLHDYVTFAEGLLQVDGPNALETENYAFFGQLDYRPVQWLGFTAGGRYTNERKAFEGGQQDLNGFDYKLFGCSDANGNITPAGPFPLAPVTCQQAIGYPDPSNPLRVYVPGVNRQTFNNFSPKLGAQLHPSDDAMLYVSWSKGYKTGGWTTRLTNPQPDAQAFGPEKATTWEIGVKSQWLDRRLQLNAAAFTTNYEGIQLNFQQGTSPTLRNAGNARIKGFEVEAVAIPARGLTVTASVGYTDAYYTSILAGVLAVSGPNPFQAGTLVGAPLPKTPKWKTNISPRYEFALGNGGKVTLLADWTHASSIWNDAQRTYLLRRAPINLVNASVAYRAPDDHWSITVGATNLTDDRYLTTGNENIADGVFFGTYSRPREWYARFGVRF